MNKQYLYIALRVLIVILAVIAGLYAVYFIGRLVIPFIIAFLIALVLNPIVEFLEMKTKLPRAYAVIVAILLVTGVISGIIALLVNEIVQGFAYMSSVMPEHYQDFKVFLEDFYMTKVSPFYSDLIDRFQGLDESQKNTILESAQMVGERLTDTLSSFFQAIGNGIYAVVKSLPTIITVLVISLLASFFISKDWYRIIHIIRAKIPVKVQTRINGIYEGLYRALFGYLKAEFKITFISAVIVLIGLLILGVEHALTIALIIWFIDFFPYIGAIIIFLPWSIYAFSTGDIFLGSGLAILYGLVVLQRQFIKPKILSSSLGISPLMTLLTMYAGFKLLGFVGIILGPLLFILLKTFHETGILRDIWRFILGTRGKIER